MLVPKGQSVSSWYYELFYLKQHPVSGFRHVSLVFEVKEGCSLDTSTAPDITPTKLFSLFPKLKKFSLVFALGSDN